MWKLHNLPKQPLFMQMQKNSTRIIKALLSAHSPELAASFHKKQRKKNILNWHACNFTVSVHVLSFDIIANKFSVKNTNNGKTYVIRMQIWRWIIIFVWKVLYSINSLVSKNFNKSHSQILLHALHMWICVLRKSQNYNVKIK